MFSVLFGSVYAVGEKEQNEQERCCRYASDELCSSIAEQDKMLVYDVCVYASDLCCSLCAVQRQTDNSRIQTDVVCACMRDMGFACFLFSFYPLHSDLPLLI